MSLLAAPYVVAGTVSLFLGYKTYNSYYNQPFEYLEIEGFEDDKNRKTQDEDKDINKGKVEPEGDDKVEPEGDDKAKSEGKAEPKSEGKAESEDSTKKIIIDEIAEKLIKKSVNVPIIMQTIKEEEEILEFPSKEPVQIKPYNKNNNLRKRKKKNKKRKF